MSETPKPSIANSSEFGKEQRKFEVRGKGENWRNRIQKGEDPNQFIEEVRRSEEGVEHKNDAIFPTFFQPPNLFNFLEIPKSNN